MNGIDLDKAIKKIDYYFYYYKTFLLDLKSNPHIDITETFKESTFNYLGIKLQTLDEIYLSINNIEDKFDFLKKNISTNLINDLLILDECFYKLNDYILYEKQKVELELEKINDLETSNRIHYLIFVNDRNTTSEDKINSYFKNNNKWFKSYSSSEKRLEKYKNKLEKKHNIEWKQLVNETRDLELVLKDFEISLSANKNEDNTFKSLYEEKTSKIYKELKHILNVKKEMDYILKIEKNNIDEILSRVQD